MRVAISATGKGGSAKADLRFGRAAFFVICDTESGERITISNEATASAHGAGIRAAQTVIDSGAEAVITGNIGPNAMEVLMAGRIKVFVGDERTVNELAEACQNGTLPEMSAPRPKHFGLR